jgi:pimeloyl-ACP methyl ester carboxylesterase
MMSDHWVKTDGAKLFARRWSPSWEHRDQQAGILLFHDSLGCVDLWRDFPQHLAVATGRCVVAYDRLGFGRSDAHPGHLAQAFIRDEAAKVVPLLCATLRLDSLIPFGHSVGGAMAIATAAQWPRRCAAVITESAQSFVEDVTLSGIRAAQSNFARPEQVERLARYHGSKARWVLDNWIETWLSPAFANWSLDEVLKGVRCPALALHGDRDEYGSLKHLERIKGLTQGACDAVILTGCGHVPHRERPSRVLDEVSRFLEFAEPAHPRDSPLAP